MRLPCLAPDAWPEVVAIVPARDEAELIGESISSLLAQDYPGRFRVLVVDDGSSDGPADIALSLRHVRDPRPLRSQNHEVGLEALRAAPLAGPASSRQWRKV